MERDQYGHSWLGCIVGRFHRTSLDAEFHLQAASRAFFAYKHRLCDETVRCEWQIACDFSMLWWHQLHFSELGTGQSTNVICKPWIVHFGSYFGRWFVLLFLLIGSVLGMNFYIIRKKTTWFENLSLHMLGTILEPWLIHCKSADPSVGVDAHLAAVVREIRDIIRLPKSLLSPGTNNWATGKM